MSLDLVTRGLSQLSGLSLTTGGMLVVSEAGGLAGLAVGAERRRVDIRVRFVPPGQGDLQVLAGELEAETSLESSVLLSLFCDARASAEELERHGSDDPRGYCLDAFAEIEGDRWGSKLWLLERETQTPETLARAIGYAQQALAHFMADGIARAVDVQGEYPGPGLIALQVEVLRATLLRERFAFVWAL